MTAAGRRVLEADPEIMELLESGEVVRMIGLGGPFATELGMHERQRQYRGNGWINWIFGRLMVLDTIQVVDYWMSNTH